MKKKFAFAKKAISAIAAFSLVATMCPVEALAAAPTTDNADPAIEEQVTADAAERPESVVSEELPVAAEQDQEASVSPEEAQEAAPTPADMQTTSVSVEDADIEVLTAQVNLSAGASTLIASNGLTYSVNADEPNTVSLVAISNQGMEGTLEIPAKIYSGSDEFAVTGICVGGGSLNPKMAI